MQAGVQLPAPEQTEAARVRTLFLQNNGKEESRVFHSLPEFKDGRKPRNSTVCAPMQTATEGYNFLIFAAALHTSLGDCSSAAGNSVFSNTHRHKTTRSAFKLKLTEMVLIQSFPFLLIFKRRITHILILVMWILFSRLHLWNCGYQQRDFTFNTSLLWFPFTIYIVN